MSMIDEWRARLADPIAVRSSEIADEVVPRYRRQKPYLTCGGSVAKQWEAAWRAACIALGRDPAYYHPRPTIDDLTPPSAP